MRAVILAGGKGTRLAPFTNSIPKPLVPIGEYPILEIILRQLKFYGITHVTLALGHMATYLRSFFGDGKQFGINIDYVVEKKPLGTAGALSLIKAPRESFFVLNGDLFTALNFKAMWRFHQKTKADATVGLYRRTEKIELGVIGVDRSNRVTEYIEKPTFSSYISMGVYILKPSVIKYVPKNKFYDLPTLITDLLADKAAVYGYKNKNFWLDIGRPDDYQVAKDLFEKNKRKFLKPL